jgi:L-alanine-DL-glutamate epimerase-like enolase superfamily enzyme
MIIANIETFPLRIPFRSGSQAAASAWGDKGLPVADSLLVRVTTDQGLEGWGETFGFRAVCSAQLAINELIAPLCIGRDATQIGPLMLDVQKKLHVFGRSGPLFYGISAVDIAMWAARSPVCWFIGFSAVVGLLREGQRMGSFVAASAARYEGIVDTFVQLFPPRCAGLIEHV